MYIVKKVDEVVYPNPYFWDISINPLASIINGLADCTTLVIGAIKSCGLPDIVPRNSGDAKSYHLNLINGWYAVPYSEYKSNIKVGDVIEWVKGNHVAIVSDTSNGVMISGSFYTGTNGKAYDGGSYSKRDGITSLKQLNDFMLKNYPYRFFHFVPLETESSWCGGEPDYVLVAPSTLIPVERDTTKNQAYVGVNGLRVRTEPNTDSRIVGICAIGYHNVAKVEGGDFGEGNTWFKVGDYYIASVKGVTYYPADELSPFEELMKNMKQLEDAFVKVKNENEILTRKLNQIKDIVED